MKKFPFFYHYNKPLSKQRGKPTISIHYQKSCHFVDNLVINVPTFGKINKRQPFFVIKGYASKIDIVNNFGYIS